MDNREKLIQKAKYLMFPKFETYLDYPNFPWDTVKLPIVKGGTYDTYKNNAHHFQPWYHREYVLPTLNAMLTLYYDKNDFTIIEKEEDGFDVSYLRPRRAYRFDTYGLTNNEILTDVGFETLRENNSKNVIYTAYHRLFRYAHDCSRIVNKSLSKGRVLVLSCDSQLIPDIPILACYFKELWCFDNRTRLSFINKINVSEVTDVLIEGGWNEEKKYLVDNLR